MEARLVHVLCTGLLMVASGGQGQPVYVGNLPTLAHGVSGSFYILDNKTFFVEDFNYDGRGPDAFLYYYEVGETPDRNGGGVIIPISETQVKFPVGQSASYTNENFTVNLQDGVKACDVGYFTIWCRQARQLFTQIEIPQDLFSDEIDAGEGKIYCVTNSSTPQDNGSLARSPTDCLTALLMLLLWICL